jgi:hypothetical protein
MAIYRLLQHTAFTPEDIALLVKAYEDCLRALNLAELPDSKTTDSKTEAVARAVIEIAQTGLRDPAQIYERVMARIGPASGR